MILIISFLHGGPDIGLFAKVMIKKDLVGNI